MSLVSLIVRMVEEQVRNVPMPKGLVGVPSESFPKLVLGLSGVATP
jgi:hypothetical protein